MCQRVPIVKADSQITIEYTLSTDDEILDTTESLAPVTIKIGTGAMHPALESCLIGLEEGENFDRLIDPSLAFGERNHDLRIVLKRSDLPQRVRELEVGDSFEGPGPDRKLHLFRVIRSDEESFVIDGNHPLAGQNLHLEGRILKVS